MTRNEPNLSDQKLDHKWLAIYLQDHYAGATAGLNLFRRVAGSHSDPKARRVVADLTVQVDKDRRELRKVMRTLKIRPSRPKEGLAWGAEKLGRLKPNGTLLRRSPLTDVVELEGLSLAVEGKALGMKTLLRLAETEPKLDAKRIRLLLDRAVAQQARLEELRLTRANEVFRQTGQTGDQIQEGRKVRKDQEASVRGKGQEGQKTAPTGQEVRAGTTDQQAIPGGRGSRRSRQSA
jgi:hypothetical protein